MVRQLLFPTEGGGALRRFLNVRKRIYSDAWNDDRPRRGPVTLLDFRRRDDVADLRSSLTSKRRGIFGCWRVSDDSVIGGYSASRMALHDDDGEGKLPPFLRWSGHVSTKIGQSHLARNVTRSGFAAILSPDFPMGVPLGRFYNALEICARVDRRTYAVNLHIETYFPEDMYQGFILGSKLPPPKIQKIYNDENTWGERQEKSEQSTPEPLDVRDFLKHREKDFLTSDPDNHPYFGHPPVGFTKLILPFKDFALTARGRMRHEQRDLDGAITIESIGFTIMDGVDGDFTFDLVSLRAVNVLNGEVVGTLEDEEREEMILQRQSAANSKSDESETDATNTLRVEKQT
ncbi:hypothetical protein ACHAXS_010128 [Conticribra weissflogii]